MLDGVGRSSDARLGQLVEPPDSNPGDASSTLALGTGHEHEATLQRSMLVAQRTGRSRRVTGQVIPSAQTCPAHAVKVMVTNWIPNPED